MDEARYREAERKLWQSVGVTPTERRVQLGHSDVAVRVQEAGEGPAVLFVHGASNSGASWASVVARLEGFRCLVMDRPGCGLSDALDTAFDTPESLGSFADTLVIDVLDGMGLDSAHLVATSFGGYAVLRAAAASPERIGRIVEFGWTVGAPLARLPALMRVASAPWVGRTMTALPVNERAVRAMFRRIGLRQALDAGRISQEVIDCYLALLRHTDTMRNELAVSRWAMRPLKGLDDRIHLRSSLLASIQTPVYFLWGEEDPFGGADIAREFVKHLPNAELELLPGAGHAVWVDDPDHAAKVIEDFLRR
jgi:2-hydroxy-6-oxonona-2,4-dienedioate hydrolase